MQSLMQSLSTDQRQELQDMMDALLRDDRLRWDLAQLAATLDALLPDGLGQRYDFQGGEQLTLQGALAQLGRLNQMDELARQMVRLARPRPSPRSIRTRSQSCWMPSRRPICAACSSWPSCSRRPATPSAAASTSS